MFQISSILPEAWRAVPVVSRDLVPCLPGEFPVQTSEDFQVRPAGNPKSKRKQSGHGRLILALIAANRPLTVTELAAYMGCCRGEASKRVKAAGKRVRCRRVGRCKFVELASKR